MDAMEAGDLLRKLDRRMQNVEQILPTLPTRDELRAEIRAAVAPLVTQEQLQERLEAATANLVTQEQLQERLEAATANLVTQEQLQEQLTERLAAATANLVTHEQLDARVAELATKAELAAAIAPLATKEEVREEGKRTRHHFDAVAESIRDDVRLLAEGVDALREDVQRGRKETAAILQNHEKRITRLEASNTRGRRQKSR